MDTESVHKTTESDAHDQYTKAYVDILSTYKEQIDKSISKKNELKTNFFWLISIIMGVLTLLFVVSIYCSFTVFDLMIKNNYESVSVIVGAVTGMITTLSTMILSIFKLPQIVAEYLFNKKEDDHMIEIIRNIQEYELESVKLGKTAKMDSETEVADIESREVALDEVIYTDTVQPTDVSVTLEQTTEVTNVPEQNEEQQTL